MLLFAVNTIMAFEYNGIYFATTGDKECRVGLNYGASGAIDIPSIAHDIWYDYINNHVYTYDDVYTVTAIGDEQWLNGQLVSYTPSFRECDGLTSISIPNSVKKICRGSFQGCINLTSVSMPNSVTYLSTFVFFGCISLTSINIPNSLTSIAEGTFRNCRSLPSITIPNSVTSIGVGAFATCISLTNITIPNSVTSIGINAFNGCSGLTSVTIGNSVTSIGYHSFGDCSGLKDIYCKIQDPNKVTLGEDVFLGVPKTTCVLHVPAGTKELFKNANQWKDFFIIDDIAEENGDLIKRFEKGYGSASDWSTYYDYDKQPTGITADGAAQMRLFVDGDINQVKSYKLTTKVNGTETSDTQLTGTFGSLQLMPYEDGTKYGILYTAPGDFTYSTEGDSYTLDVELKITNKNNKTYRTSTSFDILRPGVLLLHGLLSNEDCFKDLNNHLSANGYRDALVLNGDYHGSNAQSFVNNTYVNNVVGTRMKSLFEQLAREGIVSAKYDLVGHSMGGILSRMYAQEINANAVNRIITLDTPHSGSQLANLRNPVLNALSSITTPSPMLSLAVNALRAQLQGNGNLAAIENLAPGSSAIARLNGSTMSNAVGIPVHAICSVIQAPQQAALDNDGVCYHANPVSSLGITAIHDFLFSANNESNNQTRWEFYNLLYNGDNDGVVSYVSQAGGLSGNYVTLETDVYRGKLGFDSWAHHCKTNKWLKTYNNITLLLSEPKNSSSFNPSGFHPEQISSLKHGAPLPKLQPAGSGTSIDLQVERLTTDTTVLQIHVNRSSDVVRHMVYTFTGNDQMIFSLDEQDCRFQVPENYHGKLDIFVLGRTANGGLVADEEVLDNGFILGDVNADGAMNVSDVTTLVNMILGLLPTDKSTADVNNDGRVNVSDITALINLLLGIH